MTQTPSPRPGVRGSWSVVLLAFVLAFCVLFLSAVGVERLGVRLGGVAENTLGARLNELQPGGVVLFGNSVAVSALRPQDLREELREPALVDLGLFGSATATWYVLFQHHLAERGRAPRLLVLVTSTAGLTAALPVPDAEIALDLSTRDDPALAGALGLSRARLAWERRFVLRLRARDGLTRLLGAPLAAAVAEREGGPRGDLDVKVQQAVAATLDEARAAEGQQPGPLGAAAGAVEVLSPELAGGFVELLAATEAAGTRVVLVVLPQLQGGPTEVPLGLVMAALGDNVQVLDMTTMPLDASDYYGDHRHFSPMIRDSLSRLIAYDVSLLLLRRSARSVQVTARP